MGRSLTYAVVFERTRHNYSAYVPDLPGCVATGDTLDKCRDTITQAIAMHVQGIIEDKKPIPASSTLVEMISA